MKLDDWRDHNSNWYGLRKHDQVDELKTLLFHTPAIVFGPELTAQLSRAKPLLASEIAA